MADEQAVVADSAPAEQAAPLTGEAVVSDDVTHGEPTEQTTSTDDAASTAEPDDEDDSEDSSDEGLTEEEVKTKAERRRERRKAREQERIDRAVEERFAARERERETKAQAEQAEADTKAAADAWRQEFGSYVGTPETRATLDAEIALLTEEVGSLKPYADGTDLNVLEQKQTDLAAKVAERKRLNANFSTYKRLDEFQFRQTQGDYAAAGASLPEEHRATYLQATTVPEALTRLEAGIVAREQTKHKAELARVTTEWEGKLAKEQAAHAATRTGAPGAGPSPNGANGTGSGGAIYTRERLATMTTAEYRANKAEIERQERAGLIR